ncbi:MAG: hypothetical protein IJV72_04575, partial [Clostridia bacterium]|nr:hypothetical protein [Clostridia bacterium]
FLIILQETERRHAAVRDVLRSKTRYEELCDEYILPRNIHLSVYAFFDYPTGISRKTTSPLRAI